MTTNSPSDWNFPRTSWYTKMNPSRAKSADGPSVDRNASGPYGGDPYGVRCSMKGYGCDATFGV
jgi:hypothetical protein